jgi:AraC-like DNA-binding protein
MSAAPPRRGGGRASTTCANPAIAGDLHGEEPSVLASWTATVVRALDAHGVSGLELAAKAGIDTDLLHVQDARLPMPATTELWRLAVEVTGDPCFGVEVARFVRPGTLQGLSHGIVASDTFRDALARMGRFGSIAGTSPCEMTIAERNGRLTCIAPWRDDREQPSYEAMEAIVSSLVRAGRFLGGRSLSPIEVHLLRPAAPASDKFEQFFGCPVRYGSASYGLVYDATACARPLLGGCEAIARAADRLAIDCLNRLRSPRSTADRVREVVASSLIDTRPTARTVAADLAMSGRTLQRRLHAEGTTFRELLNEVRVDLAKELLAAEELSVQTVSDRVGFSEVAAFRRAFKRLTGVTPSAFGRRGAVGS